MYELPRVVNSALPVIGKVYYNTTTCSKFKRRSRTFPRHRITSAQRHELYQSFVHRWTMLYTDLHSAGFLLDPEYAAHLLISPVAALHR